ncbi:hypothetical protein N7540_001331 [Penicillium herquei]|nr:hypothetical protein N7540_001331 [Penicillium herquei]
MEDISGEQLETSNGYPLGPMTNGEVSQAPSLTASENRAFVQQIEEQGIQRQGWIENPGAPNCPIGRTTMSIQDLASQHIGMESSPGGAISLIRVIRDSIQSNNLPAIPESNETPAPSQYWHDTLSFYKGVSYNAYLGPGAIFMNDILRDTAYGGREDLPHISEIAHASYGSHYPTNTLRVIAFQNTFNDGNRHFVRYSLYTESNGLHLPGEQDTADYQHARHEWGRGTAQYNALLGTPLGNVATAIMLNFFDRGTHRIASIITVGESHLEFRIEPIP